MGLYVGYLLERVRMRLRVALLGFHPEVALETLSQLLRLATQALGARPVPVDVVQIGDPHLRRVHVRLHLDQRRWELRPFAVRIAPRERALGVREKVPPESTVGGPFHRLREHHREERRGVDRSVVRVMRDLAQPRELTATELVEDLPGLLLCEVIDLVSLIAREKTQRPPRDV